LGMSSTELPMIKEYLLVSFPFFFISLESCSPIAHTITPTKHSNKKDKHNNVNIIHSHNNKYYLMSSVNGSFSGLFGFCDISLTGIPLPPSTTA
ncbi:hypothetical protein ACXX9E_29275, partial [Pseudomonas sp. GNP014]